MLLSSSCFLLVGICPQPFLDELESLFVLEDCQQPHGEVFLQSGTPPTSYPVQTWYTEVPAAVTVPWLAQALGHHGVV
jgi:hypothetical protein